MSHGERKRDAQGHPEVQRAPPGFNNKNHDLEWKHIIKTNASKLDPSLTVHFKDSERLRIPFHKQVYWQTQVKIVNADAFDTARDMQDEGFNPAVLNLASEFVPGGGWRRNGGGQEESLCRRSSLPYSLEPLRSTAYPIAKAAGIYTPSVLVAMELHGKWMRDKDCFHVGVITVPAVRKPALSADGSRMLAEGTQTTKNKIRTIFRIAYHYRHDALVLGAFGCGFFMCPARHTALMFREVLEEPEFAGAFKMLTWAILGNSTDTRTTRTHFKEVLTAEYIPPYKPPGTVPGPAVLRNAREDNAARTPVTMGIPNNINDFVAAASVTKAAFGMAASAIDNSGAKVVNPSASVGAIGVVNTNAIDIGDGGVEPGTRIDAGNDIHVRGGTYRQRATNTKTNININTNSHNYSHGNGNSNGNGDADHRRNVSDTVIQRIERHCRDVQGVASESELTYQHIRNALKELEPVSPLLQPPLPNPPVSSIDALGVVADNTRNQLSPSNVSLFIRGPPDAATGVRSPTLIPATRTALVAPPYFEPPRVPQLQEQQRQQQQQQQQQQHSYRSVAVSGNHADAVQTIPTNGFVDPDHHNSDNEALGQRCDKDDNNTNNNNNTHNNDQAVLPTTAPNPTTPAGSGSYLTALITEKPLVTPHIAATRLPLNNTLDGAGQFGYANEKSNNRDSSSRYSKQERNEYSKQQNYDSNKNGSAKNVYAVAAPAATNTTAEPNTNSANAFSRFAKKENKSRNDGSSAAYDQHQYHHDKDGADNGGWVTPRSNSRRRKPSDRLLHDAFTSMSLDNKR